MVDSDSFLDLSLLLLHWSFDFHLINGVGLQDLSHLKSDFRKGFLHRLVELLLELLLEPLSLLVLAAVLEFPPEGELAVVTVVTVVTAFLMLFLLHMEGLEPLFELRNGLDQTAGAVDLLLDGDFEDDPRLKVFRAFERKQVGFHIVKVDFGLRALHSGLLHESAAVLLDLLEVHGFQDLWLGLSEMLSHGSDLALDAGFEFPKNLKRVVLLGVGVKPELPLVKFKGLVVELLFVLSW